MVWERKCTVINAVPVKHQESITGVTLAKALLGNKMDWIE
jgi:hypothetical protein